MNYRCSTLPLHIRLNWRLTLYSFPYAKKCNKTLGVIEAQSSQGQAGSPPEWKALGKQLVPLGEGPGFWILVSLVQQLQAVHADQIWEVPSIHESATPIYKHEKSILKQKRKIVKYKKPYS